MRIQHSVKTALCCPAVGERGQTALHSQAVERALLSSDGGETCYGAGTKAFLAPSKPLILVHRAVGLGKPENSLQAMQAASEHGFTHVETDVRTTRDGVPVLAHDRRAAPVQAGAPSSLIAALTHQELVERFGGSSTAPPTLEEVLTLCPTVNLNLDVKDRASARLVPLVVASVGASDRVCVTSFSERRLVVAARLLDERATVGMSTTACLRLLARSLMARVNPGSCGVRARDVAQIPYRTGNPLLSGLYRAFVTEAHNEGLQVHAWTVNDIASMTQALQLGFDGLVTDRPFEARRAVQDFLTATARRN